MSYYRRGYKKNIGGNKFAERHIQEAEAFSTEIGGTDKDVKEYFFSLSRTELNAILSQYGIEYGSSAESYAREAFSRWKSGATKMSGLVAKRLFSILPPRMPLSKKYELAENVWIHFGPKSKASFVVSFDACVEEVAHKVALKLDNDVTYYSIPSQVKNRFDWLSSGDVTIQEQLLNHFRNLQKNLAIERVRKELPILQNQMKMNPDTTGLLRSVIAIHKHEVSIYVENKIGGSIEEKVPYVRPRGEASYASLSSPSSSPSWFWWAAGIAFILYLMSQ